MNKNRVTEFLNTFGVPVLMVLLGLVLLVNPDGATAMVAKVLGCWLVIGGAVTLIIPAVKKQPIRGKDWVANGLCILVGVLLVAKPLALTDSIGRFLGILLLIQGFGNFRTGGFNLVTILTIVAGAVLLVMPRTLTQTLLGLCGLVLIIVGIVNIAGKYRQIKQLEEGRDPSIVDADE